MSTVAIWHSPPQSPILRDNQVHIWRASLDLPPAQVDYFASLLAPDEVTKANKFRFPVHRRRYIVARGILRQLLANYLHLRPQEIGFEYGDRGKPYLSDFDSLQFNVSHSHESVLYGVSDRIPIGVDVEYLRKMPDAAKIARRFFSAKEYELIDRVVETEQQRLFFQLWTAKEAYLKALGVGLAGSLNSVELEVNPIRLVAVKGSKSAAADWSVYSCGWATNYIAAIAIKAQKSAKEVNFWQWS